MKLKTLGTNDIKEKILETMQERGGEFKGTAGELFDALKIKADYKQSFYSAVSSLRKQGLLDANASGVGSLPTVYWLLEDEVEPEVLNSTNGKADKEFQAKHLIDMAVQVTDDLAFLIKKIREVVEENQTLRDERNALVQKLGEIQAVVND